MAIFQELENHRLNLYTQYKNEQKKGNFAIIGLVASAIFMFLTIDLGIISTVMFICLIVSIIFTSVFYSKAAKIKKNFDTLVKDQFVQRIIDQHIPDASFHENNHIPINKINSAGLVKGPDRYRGEDLIIGKYRDVNFQVSDITLTEKRVVSNGKTTTVQYIDYFQGRWYIYKFDKNFNETIKITESGYGTTTRGLKKYETEMIEFNKKFTILSSDEHFFYYIMNPFLIEKLLLLEKSHRGHIHYCFMDDELHIGINDNSNSLQLDFRKPINEQSIKGFIEDIVLIKTIIDELRLYDVKFKN